MYIVTLWIVWKDEIKIKTIDNHFEIEESVNDSEKEYISIDQYERKWNTDVCVKRFYIKKSIVDFITHSKID